MMRRRVALLASLAPLAVAAIPYGCASRPAHDGAGTEGAEPEVPQIVGGKPINSPGDPISSAFPLSTVALSTPIPDSGFYVHSCTGVIVSNNQILTAAHCMADSTTQVGFYNNITDQPVNWIQAASAVTPKGINCLANQTDDSGCHTSTGVLMDLAVVTLSQNIPAGYQPANLGPCGQYAANYQKSAWEVGVGKINGSSNSAQRMQWVPVKLPPTDSNGEIDTATWYADHGDSGGPIYQLEAPSDDAGTDSGAVVDGGVPGSLVVVGITHAMSGLPDSGNVTNSYTSVESSATCMWVLLQTLAPPQPPIIIARKAADKIDLDLDTLLGEGVRKGVGTTVTQELIPALSQ